MKLNTNAQRHLRYLAHLPSSHKTPAQVNPTSDRKRNTTCDYERKLKLPTNKATQTRLKRTLETKI